MESILADPIVLKVEASMAGRLRGAVKEQRTMVRDDGSEASQVAFAMDFLPVSGA
jgi:hypothetical protein